MIEKEVLQQYAQKKETSFRNVLREYLQHLFLASFYTKRGSEDFLFKGGTALKLIFGSPRFSEDLDFSGKKNSLIYEKILEEVLLDLSWENIKVDLEESKTTSGGHLAIFKAHLFGENLELRNEISFRAKAFLKKEALLITSEITPSYKVWLLEKKIMLKEKLEALITRQKPRDFFDLYFILRKEELRQTLKIEEKQRKATILSLRKQKKGEISQELKRLLPRSFWPLVKNLPAILEKELERT